VIAVGGKLGGFGGGLSTKQALLDLETNGNARQAHA
jgi:O6-methylguanine-DNA--protein-cysteine methyltransferase